MEPPIRDMMLQSEKVFFFILFLDFAAGCGIHSTVYCGHKCCVCPLPPSPPKKKQKTGSALTRTPILDLSCGPGYVGNTLRSAGMRGSMTGVDISRKMAEAAASTGAYQHLHVGDMDDPLRFAAASFGLVTWCGASEMIHDLPAALAEIARVTGTNGRLWMTFQHNKGPGTFNPTAHQGVAVSCLSACLRSTASPLSGWRSSLAQTAAQTATQTATRARFR